MSQLLERTVSPPAERRLRWPRRRVLPRVRAGGGTRRSPTATAPRPRPTPSPAASVSVGSILTTAAVTGAGASALTALVDDRKVWWATVFAATPALLTLLVLTTAEVAARRRTPAGARRGTAQPGGGGLEPPDRAVRGLRVNRRRFGLVVGLAVIGLAVGTQLLALDTGRRLPSGNWFGDAWQDLMVGPLPAGPGVGVIALAVTCWLAGTLSAIAGLAGARLLATVPGTLLLVIAAGLADLPWWAPVSFVAATAVALAHGASPVPVPVPVPMPVPGSSAPLSAPAVRRGKASWLHPALVLACCLAAMGPVLATQSPKTRQAAAVPPRIEQEASPLVWVSAWQNEPARTVFTASGDASLFRWATLARYDGATWRSEGTFGPTGPQVRLAGDAALQPTGSASLTAQSPSARTASTRVVSARVSDVELPGRWLPSPGVPTRVDGGAVLLDPGSGDLLTGEPAAAGSYAVIATVTTPDAETLRAVRQRPRGSAVLHADDPVSPVFATQAGRATVGAATDADRLAALAQWCRDNIAYDRKAVPGQSVQVLESVATGQRPATMDQIVGAYALMSRGLGYPTRVVVGFAPNLEQPGAATGRSGPVRSTEVVAWPEVYLDGIGWHAFYPVALPGVDTGMEVVRTQVSADPVTPATAAESATPVGPTGPAVGSGPDRSSDRAATPLLVASAATLLAVAGIATIALRRRRRRGTAAEQLLDAWNWLRRKLARRHGEQIAACTPGQLVAVVADLAGEQAARSADALALAVTGVLYGDAQPDPGDVAAAWRRARDVSRAVRRGRRRP